jgi:hypothetical protein
MSAIASFYVVPGEHLTDIVAAATPAPGGWFRPARDRFWDVLRASGRELETFAWSGWVFNTLDLYLESRHGLLYANFGDAVASRQLSPGARLGLARSPGGRGRRLAGGTRWRRIRSRRRHGVCRQRARPRRRRGRSGGGASGADHPESVARRGIVRIDRDPIRRLAVPLFVRGDRELPQPCASMSRSGML